MPAGTLYYVLREGSTREEQWSWSEIEDLCKSGELTPGARIFLPDEDRWAQLGETRAAASLAPGRGRAPEDTDEQEVDQAQLQKDYAAAIERMEEEPGALEAHLDAGILALQLGLRDEARAHFQTVLHRYPYHARAAHEIKRRFSKTEVRAFRYLERPAPAWEDLGELVAMPLARGPLYVIIPAAVLAALGLVPFGGIAVFVLTALWVFQVMEYTARGATRPAEWNRSLKDPWKKLLRPALLVGLVVAQWVALFAGVTRLSLLAQGRGDEALLPFMAQSPVVLVLGAVVAVTWLPAAMVSIGGFTGSVGKTLDPRRLVRTIVRMEHEYIYTVALLSGIAVAVVIPSLLTARVPVLGDLLLGAALAYAAPLAGLVLGRLLGRMGHVIE